jgi:hypothetical protein
MAHCTLAFVVSHGATRSRALGPWVSAVLLASALAVSQAPAAVASIAIGEGPGAFSGGLLTLLPADGFAQRQAAPANPAPRSVTDLAARARSSRRIQLTFSAPAVGAAAPEYALPARRYVIKQSRRPITAASFGVARSLCGGTCGFAAGRPGDRIRLTVEDLVPNRLYYYALRPFDGTGRLGILSNVANAKTLKDRRRPGRPTGLSARSPRGRQVRLRFRAPGSDGRKGPPVRRYIIKQSKRPITSARRFRRARSLCRGSCRFAPRRRGARMTLLVRALCPGRRYYYSIRAKDEGGNLSRVARFRSVRAKGRGGLTCL